MSAILSEVFDDTPGEQMVKAEHRARDTTSKVHGVASAMQALLAIPAAQIVEDWRIDREQGDLNERLQTMLDDLTAYVAAVKAIRPQRLRVVPERHEADA